MKASVFILEGQETQFREISALLRAQLFKDIQIERFEIDRKYNPASGEDMHRHCRKYLHFLRASVLSSGAFEIVANNDSLTEWCYFGYTAEHGTYCFELKHMLMDALFPAVAVADRMVMMPEAFTRSLDVYPRTFLWLPQPLDLRGVELVDYAARGALEYAVRRVGKQLKQEWRTLCHRHMGVRGLFKPDFHELSELLKVDSLFLAENNLFSTDVRIAANVVGEGRAGKLTRATLELRNEGGRVLRNIRVRLRAPANALRHPISEICDLLPPDPLRIEFDITPRTSPWCPLEVFVDLGEEPVEVPAYPIPVHMRVS